MIIDQSIHRERERERNPFSSEFWNSHRLRIRGSDGMVGHANVMAWSRTFDWTVGCPNRVYTPRLMMGLCLGRMARVQRLGAQEVVLRNASHLPFCWWSGDRRYGGRNDKGSSFHYSIQMHTQSKWNGSVIHFFLLFQVLYSVCVVSTTVWWCGWSLIHLART